MTDQPKRWPMIGPHPDPAPASSPDDATWAALAVAVGLVTASLGGTRLRHGELAADIPAGQVVTAMVVLTAATLREFLGDEGAALLRDLGLTALAGGSPLEGGTCARSE